MLKLPTEGNKNREQTANVYDVMVYTLMWSICTSSLWERKREFCFVSFSKSGK